MDIGDGVFDQFPLLSRDIFWHVVSFATNVDAIVTEYIHPTSPAKRRFIYAYVFDVKPSRDIKNAVRESVLRHDYDDDVHMLKIDDVGVFVGQAAAMGALKVLYLFALNEEQAVDLFEHTKHEHVRAYLMYEYMKTPALWTKAIHDATLQAIVRNDIESAMYYMYHNTDWSDAEQWANSIISHDNVAMWQFFRRCYPSFEMNDRVLRGIVLHRAIDILTYIRYVEQPPIMDYEYLLSRMQHWRGKDPSLLLLPEPKRDVLSDLTHRVMVRAAESSINALYVAHAQYSDVKIAMPVNVPLVNLMYLWYHKSLGDDVETMVRECGMFNMTLCFQFLTYAAQGGGYHWSTTGALFILRQNATMFFRALTITQDKNMLNLREAFTRLRAYNVPLDVWRYFYRTHMDIRPWLIVYALTYYQESEWDLQLQQNNVLGYMLCIENATDNQLVTILKKSNDDTFESAKDFFLEFETASDDDGYDAVESHYPQLISMITRYRPEWNLGFNNGALVKAAIAQQFPKTTASLLQLNSVREHYSVANAVRDRQLIQADPDNPIVDDDMIDVLTRYINAMRGEAEPDLKKVRSPIYH